MLKKLWLLGIGSFLFSQAVFAIQDYPYGINFSTAVIAKDPPHLYGYRASFIYQPPTWHWGRVDVFIDTSYGHWWVTHTTQYHNLSIWSVAPVLRYFFKEYDYFWPYLDLSIGPSYLTQSRLDDRNLGIHFAFQDQIGVGTTIGPTRQFAIGINVLHYSNGSMSAMNAGISVPMMLNLSYRF